MVNHRIFRNLFIFIIILSILLWKFTQLSSVDDEKKRVIILGGLIDINGKSGKVNVGSRLKDLDDTYSTTIDGSKEIGKSTDKISVSFSNGAFQFTSTTGQKELKWQYQGGSPGSPSIAEAGGNLVLDFHKLEGTNCKVQLPDGISSIVKGISGKIVISKPRSSLDIQLDNGQIAIAPEANLQYKYQVQIKHGYSDNFVSSTSSKAVEIKINLTNGYINKENF